MSDIKLEGVPKGIVAALAARAKAQGRSVEDEALAILEQAIAEGSIPPIRLMAHLTNAPREPKQNGDD